MKKVTKLVTLISTGLCALALVPAYLATVNAVQAQAENDTHSITFVADSGVTVNVPVVARAGKVVDFTLSYDAEAYEVYGVVINSNQLAAETADGYYFVMPDEDVELTVYGSGITDEENHTYAVNNVQQEKGVVLNYTTPTAEAGEYVIFNIGFTATSAYTWAGDFSVYTLDAKGNKDVINAVYYLSSYNAYYFTMPEAEVFIDVKVETKGYLATFDTVDNIEKVETSSDGGAHWNVVYGNPYFIKAYDQVKVTVKDTLKRSCSGITVDGKAYMVEEGKNEIVFEMPAAAAEIEVNTEDILYEITADTDDLTSHYDFKIYRCDTASGEYVETTKGACYQQYVRVYPTLKEGLSGKKVGTLRALWDTTTTYSWTEATKGEDEDGNTYFQFYMSYGKPYTLRVTVENEAKPVAVKNTDHITAKYVKKVDGKWVENTEGFYAGDYVYAQIVAEEGYKPGDAKVSYKYSEGSSYGGSTLMSVYDADNNVYRTNATITSTAYVDYAIEWTELSPRAVNFTEDELASFKFVKQDEKHDWVDATGTKYYKGDYCYVQATFTGSDEDYIWSGITAKYGATSLTITTQSATDKIYSFIMPDADVTVAANYKSLSAYKGYAFCGTFYGAEFYNNSFGNSSAKSANGAYTMIMDGSGAGKYGTSYNFTIDELGEGSTKDSGYFSKVSWRYGSGSPTVKSGKIFYYGKEWVAGYYSQMAGSSDTCTDYNLAVKAEEGDTMSMYTFKGNCSGWSGFASSSSNKGYAALSAYRNGVLYSSMFIDKTDGYNRYYLSGVTFEFTSGDSIQNKTTAIFDVKVDGVKIGTVNCGVFTRA